MPVKKYNPTSPGTRFMTVSTFEEITKKEPEKSLLGTPQKDWRQKLVRKNYGSPPRRGSKKKI